mmetsp:Transcript_99496/g.160424  ORF Transcript_99496/g.160424 Transcript_99496/m.160424 type:complete len:681 (+) Transcript_99496:56-2098(+)
MRDSPMRLPAALLLVSAQSLLLVAAQHAPVMCALPKAAQKCPIWTEHGYKHQGEDGAPMMAMPFDPVMSQQDVPCIAHAATCRSDGGYQCDYTQGLYGLGHMTQDKWYELKPGSPAVCAHGNREFSFMATKRADQKKLVIMLSAGGVCWDARTCGDPQARQVAIDALGDQVPNPGTGTSMELAPSVPRALRYSPLSNSGRAAFEQGLLKRTSGNFFGTWSAVVVPDCTGDLHTGNSSYTYDEGKTSCITAHHKGSVNTGESMKWVLENFKDPTHILLVGSAQPSSKATGGHGVIFWASYLSEKYPHAIVRTVTDSSMGINGPMVKSMLHDDPWGTKGARIPDWDTYPVDETDPERLLRVAPNGGYLMPDPADWNVADDSLTDAYRLMAKVMPKLGFADVSSTEDEVQKSWFAVTGGSDHDCCLDGCGCSTAQPHGVRGGRLDWTKTRKVAVLQRQLRVDNNYRSWIHEGADHFMLLHDSLYTSTTLQSFLSAFAQATITLENKLNVLTKRTETQVTTTLPASQSCAGCLDGVLGLGVGAEQCLMTWGQGENFYTVAAMFKTDWMALWSLNGGDAPDVAQVGMQYRFAHEYYIRPGETMESIADRFGTDVETLVHLNKNLITSLHNPRRVSTGDTICLVPSFHGTMDQMGLPICPSDRQTFGEPTTGGAAAMPAVSAAPSY